MVLLKTATQFVESAKISYGNESQSKYGKFKKLSYGEKEPLHFFCTGVGKLITSLFGNKTILQINVVDSESIVKNLELVLHHAETVVGEVCTRHKLLPEFQTLGLNL